MPKHPVDVLLDTLTAEVEKRVRSQIATNLRAFPHTVSMSGHCVFDVNTLAEMVEKGEL